MDRAEARKWHRLLIKEDKSNEENIVQFMLENFDSEAAELMRQIIKEENLIERDNMNRKLAELENEVDSDEVFYSKSEIKEFTIKEGDEIWK